MCCSGLVADARSWLCCLRFAALTTVRIARVGVLWYGRSSRGAVLTTLHRHHMLGVESPGLDMERAKETELRMFAIPTG